MSTLMMSLVVKVTIILALGLGLTAFLRGATASLRHVILLGSLISALLLPVLTLVAPRWDVAVFDPVSRVTSAAAAAATGQAVPSQDFVFPRTGRDLVPGTSAELSEWVAAPAATSNRFSPLFLILGWVFGSLAVLAWLALGHLRLRSLRKSSWPLDGIGWNGIVREEALRAGIDRKIQLLCHPDVTTPLTWGSTEPVVMLPEEALEWQEDHRRIVLRHELAHVARNDARSQLAAAVTCAVYWFHPLVWIAERRLRAECERACDDSVVAAGTPAAVYAAHLLEVARAARSFGGPGFLSVAMARPSELEGRLLAVLNRAQPSAALSTSARWLTLTSIVGAALLISAFRPVHREEPPAVLAGNAEEIKPEKPVAVSSPRVDAPLIASIEAPAVTPAARILEADSIFERTIDVRSGGTLTLDFARSGATITITGWDRPEVSVRGRLGGRNWRETETTLEPVQGGVLLRNVYVGTSGNTSFNHAFDISVPRNFNVRLRSAGGGLSISGVSGSFTGTTGGGAIAFDNASGEANLSTGGGDITVTNSSLKGSVSTGGGAVTIDRSGRDLVGSSGSGDVTYTNSRSSSATIDKDGIPRSAATTTRLTGDHSESAKHFGEEGIQKHRAGGDITIDEAPNGARVTTGGGAIRIGPSGGEVYATTGGGPIQIAPASGSVIASTGAGDVTVTFRGSGLHAADLTSGLGRIELILPNDINAELVLETAYTNNLGHKTKIESDWALQVTETDNWDASMGTPRRYVRARQILGKGGGLIRVRTVNGNVVLKKAG